jgi:hypothetical protein
MTELIGVAAVLIVAWFAAGTIVNVRKGRALMRWMQDGLPLLGSRAAVRWLGSTVVELAIREADAPFAGATLVIFLEPRDLPWWPLSRLAGRRDTLIVRGVLRRKPDAELEALDAASWSGRDALPRVPREWPARSAAAAGGLTVHHSSPQALARADALIAVARNAGLRPMRLSLRRAEPNFQLHVPLPDTARSSRGFFEAVQTLAQRAVA